MIVLTAKEFAGAFVRFTAIFSFLIAALLLLRQEVGLMLHQKCFDRELIYETETFVDRVLRMDLFLLYQDVNLCLLFLAVESERIVIGGGCRVG